VPEPPVVAGCEVRRIAGMLVSGRPEDRSAIEHWLRSAGYTVELRSLTDERFEVLATREVS
jgi:hypothetical protein